MPRRYHATRARSTNGRRADRTSERALAEALGLLDQVYADVSAQEGARGAAHTVVEAATRMVTAARAARARAADALTARVERLEFEARRTRRR